MYPGMSFLSLTSSFKFIDNCITYKVERYKENKSSVVPFLCDLHKQGHKGIISSLSVCPFVCVFLASNRWYSLLLGTLLPVLTKIRKVWTFFYCILTLWPFKDYSHWLIISLAFNLIEKKQFQNWFEKVVFLIPTILCQKGSVTLIIFCYPFIHLRAPCWLQDPTFMEAETGLIKTPVYFPLNFHLSGLNEIFLVCEAKLNIILSIFL